MSKFYFTYGLEGYDFVGGWTEVIVDAPGDPYTNAVNAFELSHPKTTGFVHCAGIYPEEEFKMTRMYENGNLGRRCHEQISYIARRYNDER